ncbi:rcc01693 family protein [Roseobacter denitrificans]|uniref:Phage tail assembly chaperone n=1 Tax=Roseobacter denitrificans (strain ATCC 33942 / OCh 114) TaxID=375451 RepID=Q164Q6_ROSDO|nr:rcc01693 family protein [Roseobacter denitrificans]ABG32537.1 conserved hypothetical protein [Roseobacter denitrificans OCh 114]SFF83232.1 phage conserved hypothetical protein [Roseobacter denitrificans OCh 114]
MSQIEWPVLMRAGIQNLGLQPDVFWSLTPAEFRLLLGDATTSGPLLSDGLEALMDAFPDKT